jgi:hypothetical protein
MAFKTETVNKMPMKTGAGSNLPMNIWTNKDLTYIMDGRSRSTT